MFANWLALLLALPVRRSPDLAQTRALDEGGSGVEGLGFRVESEERAV